MLTMNPLLRVNFFNHSSSNLCQFAHSMFSCIGQYADLHFAERNFSLKYSRNRLEKNKSGTSLHKKGVSMANLAGIRGLEAREKVGNIILLPATSLKSLRPVDLSVSSSQAPLGSYVRLSEP